MERRSRRFSYLGWACICIGATVAGWADIYAVKHQDRYTTMTEDTYRLHRLLRAALIGGLSGAAYEHFIVADGE